MKHSNCELETERLHLVPFNQEDTELFLQLNTDAFIRKFMWDDTIIDRETAEEVIQQNEQHFKNDQYGIWKVFLNQSRELIGYAGLWFFFDEPQPQLIYAILEPHTKQGYATEASRSVIEYAFRELNFTYIIAATDEPHKESQQVARRLGMHFAEKRMENNKPTLFFRLDR